MYKGTKPDLTDAQMSKVLKNARNLLHINSTHMASLLNVPFATYSGWECGRIKVRHKTILRLALDAIMSAGERNEESK